MKLLTSLLVLALASGFDLAAAQTPWADDFDDLGAYSPGQNPTSPSTKGWESWNLQPLIGSAIRTTQKRSSPHSLFIGLNADTLQRFVNVTTNTWSAVNHVYVPTVPGPDRLTKPLSWVLLNTYVHNGPKNTSLQMVFEPSGALRFEGGPNHGKSFTGFPNQWAELRAVIDLDTDSCQVFFGLPTAATPIGSSFQWSQGVTGAGAVAVEAFDLFANNQQNSNNPTGGVYFDDLELRSAGGTPTTNFCTAKTTLICGPPAIFATGTSSASSTSGFVVGAGPVRGCRAAMLLYTRIPPVPALSFGGPGNGQLCMLGVRRAGPIDAGGTHPNFCDGTYNIDMNAFATGNWLASGCAPAPGQTLPNNILLHIGTLMHAQIWGRDSPGTGQVLTDGISWVIGP